MADPITQPVVPTSVSNAASAAGVTLTAQQPTGYTPPNPPSQPTLGAAGYTVPNEDPTVAAGTAFEAAQANAPYDPDKIKSDTIAGFQNQIDALKQVYSQKLADAHAQGLNRLGQASVGQSRAGLIGSGSAGQQNDTIQSDNNSIEGGITAEENSAIAGINSTAQTAANDAADKALAAKNSGINAYTASINAKAATTKDLITKTAQNILAGGLSDATLTPDFFNQVAQNFSNSGYTVTGADLKAAYAAAKTAKDASDAATAKAGQTTLSEGQSIVGPDGKVVASVAPKVNTSIQSNVNGRTVLVNTDTGEVIKDLGPTTSVSTSSSAGSDADIASYAAGLQAGTVTAAQIPANIRGQVLAAYQKNGGSSADDLTSTTKQSIAELNDMVTKNQGFTAAVGAPSLFQNPINAVGSIFGAHGVPRAGSPAADFTAKLNQAKNDVILPNLKILHGLGRVTDREFQALSSSVTSLGTQESEGQFKSDLKDVTDRINALSTTPDNSATSSQGSDTQAYTANGLTYTQGADGLYHAQ